MAQLTGLGYRPGETRLHRIDGRGKLAALVALSLAGLNASPWALGALSIAAVAAISTARLSLGTILRELRYFFILLALILLARGLFTPGAPVVTAAGFSLSLEGLADGGRICWRLLLVVVLGMVFVSTTRSSEIRSAIAWVLKPVPGIPEGQVATMIGLLIRFLPVIFAEVSETSLAQRARGSERQKNPVRRTVRLLSPVMRRTFLRADQLTLAMVSRGYCETSPPMPIAMSRSDRGFLVVTLAFAAAMALI
jgi:biotin transport system permease protein